MDLTFSGSAPNLETNKKLLFVPEAFHSLSTLAWLVAHGEKSIMMPKSIMIPKSSTLVSGEPLRPLKGLSNVF